MARPVMITCAVTGGGDTVPLSPKVPFTPEAIAGDCIAAAKAGASIVHIHVRDPQTGKPSMEVAHYREVVRRIRDSGNEVLINLTTWPGARFTPSPEDPRRATPDSSMASPEDRVAHVLELKPDVCSLDVATMNFGEHAFVNVPDHLRRMAAMIRSAGVKPEIEVFDLGHARLAAELVAKGHLDSPALFQLCLGVPWGAPATTEAMLAMRSLLPAGSVWAGFGISRMQIPMVAQAAILGGHARVGLEDNLYLSKGVLATNAQLVERAVQVIRALGEEPATPKQARELLGLQHGA